jgi:hypothetical protein
METTDGGPARVLEVVDTDHGGPGAQIGLHYGDTIDLKVSYHLADANDTPIPGATVTFAIFDDPGGSTLASDHAVTDSGGLASVKLTAGAEEKSFRVRAHAPDAPDALFGVSVSSQAFVNIDVLLDDSSQANIATLKALLFVGMPCAQLPQNPSDASALRVLSQSGGATGTLTFLNLLSQSYAIVGEALDNGGRLAASGCVDIAATLVPAGATATLPLPLHPVTLSVTGSFTLATQLTVATAIADAATAPWRALVTCAEAPAQTLLDRIESGVSSSLAASMESLRGTPDSSGCRPATAGGMSSLDAQLEPLLTASGSPGAQLPSIVADLQTIVASAHLGSTLTIAGAGAGALTGEHALDSVTLATGTAQKSYAVPATSLPVIDVKDVPLSFASPTLTIGAHGFTLGLPVFWQMALGDLSIASRTPSVQPTTARALLGAVVGAAMHGGKSGCAAVEDLVCTAITSGCAGNIAPACTAALDPMAQALDAPFQPPTGIDVTLSGSATASDTNGDLLVDTLSPGNFTTALAQAMSAPFTGTRSP